MHTITRQPVHQSYMHTITRQPVHQSYMHTITRQSVHQSYMHTITRQPFISHLSYNRDGGRGGLEYLGEGVWSTWERGVGVNPLYHTSLTTVMVT